VDEPKTLTDLDELKTPKVGGGYEYWVRKSKTKLTTKHINKNGTYPASSDGYYGFKSVTVNVRGGNGSADSHGKPTGTIPPGDIGSAVIGEDEDGNDAVIGVDENGKLVKTPIPTAIVLVTDPTKMNYNDREPIDLSGAVVVAKMADGTTWTDADHPNGHVSCSPDPATADKSKAKEGGYTSDLDLTPFTPPLITNSNYIRFGLDSTTPGGSFESDWTLPNGVRAVCWFDFNPSSLDHNRWVGILIASPDATSVTSSKFIQGSIHHTDTVSLNLTYTYDGKTVYYYYDNTWAYQYQGGGFEIGTTVNGTNQSTGDPSSPQEVAWTIIHGTAVLGGQEIALNWARPGDGKVLSTTMEINVGAHTTESSSGTE
jgi:hypothetical protein